MPQDSNPRFALVARDERNGLAESWHFGAAAACTPDGRVVARLGDPELPAFLRSVAKPFQSIPVFETGIEEAFGLEAEDVAIACASHCGSPEHVDRVVAMLARVGLDESALACGPHPPLDPAVAAALDGPPSRLHNSCSGKHAAMLLACEKAGWDRASYAEDGHPLQVEIRSVLAAVTGLADDELATAVDGCGLPTFTLPLRATATAWARLADPAASGLDARLQGGLRKAVEAMAACPAMVAGPGRFTTRLIEASGGRLIGKEGAGGFYTVAVRGPVAMGVALKIADGTETCRDGVVMEVLRQLGVLSGAEFEELHDFLSPPVGNWVGVEVGRTVPDLELETVEPA